MEISEDKKRKVGHVIKCEQCGIDTIAGHPKKRFCSLRCKYRFFNHKYHGQPKQENTCTECGVLFPLDGGSKNKSVCSEECRKKRMSRMNSQWLDKVKAGLLKPHKQPPKKSVAERFFSINPDAPRCCESCGEDRIIEVAHKPGFERKGAPHKNSNMVWPRCVWVLCPTCHRLIDLMKYPPESMRLKL